MNILDTLDENTLFEVLVATVNPDGTSIVRPFGVRYVGGSFIFNLFPNHSLSNIKDNGKLTVCFTGDVLLFVRALLCDLTFDGVEDCVDCAVVCDVSSVESVQMEDSIGKNITYKIVAKPIKIIEHGRSLPVISRATNHIIELLVILSRYQYMDVDVKNRFHEKVRESEEIISKTGNNKHKKAIQLIKKEIGLEE